MLVQVQAKTVDDLFMHRFQTDQLFVVKRSFVLVVLQNREYRYVPLSDRQPQVVKIPPSVPHASINPNPEDCLVVNAVLRHGSAHERDYRPLKPPVPFDLTTATESLGEMTRGQGEQGSRGAEERLTQSETISPLHLRTSASHNDATQADSPTTSKWLHRCLALVEFSHLLQTNPQFAGE
jgi:hypothetical protein